MPTEPSQTHSAATIDCPLPNHLLVRLDAWRASAAQHARIPPTASGDPVRSSLHLRAISADAPAQRTSRLQATSANVLVRIEKRHDDVDGCPLLEPLQTRGPRRAPQTDIIESICASCYCSFDMFLTRRKLR